MIKRERERKKDDFCKSTVVCKAKEDMFSKTCWNLGDFKQKYKKEAMKVVFKRFTYNAIMLYIEILFWKFHITTT